MALRLVPVHRDEAFDPSAVRPSVAFIVDDPQPVLFGGAA